MTNREMPRPGHPVFVFGDSSGPWRVVAVCEDGIMLVSDGSGGARRAIMRKIQPEATGPAYVYLVGEDRWDVQPTDEEFDRMKNLRAEASAEKQL